MIALLKLNVTDTDSFCSKINTLKSTVIAVEADREVYIKSLISLITLFTFDYTRELTLKIISDDDYELKRFKEIVEQYGGKIID